MKIRGDYLDEDEQFFIFRDKSPVQPQNIRNLLRDLLKNLNLDPLLYDVHSFRSGRTVDLSKFGYSLEKDKINGKMEIKCCL